MPDPPHAQTAAGQPDDYGPWTYGDRIAEVYDEWTEQMDPAPVVTLLAELVREGGRALELGIGTGRVALPLARLGVHVEGIEASLAMLAKLRAKEGGASIAVTIGDFADVAVEGAFALVYVPFTTFFGLPSQREQLRCLVNVAAHLEAGGHFVLDAFVPDPSRFVDHQSVHFQGYAGSGVRLDVARHDPVDQRIESAHVVLGEDGIKIYPVHLRYAWPAELDAMAVASGLEPVARYQDYMKAPFGPDSSSHVSVYRRPHADDWGEAL